MVILSAVVGAVAGVVTTAWKSRKDLEAQYDIDLRQRRITAYAELWKLLEPLADYFEPAAVTRQAARELGAGLRRWYFSTGGLVLSEATRPAYFNLQQALEGVTAPDSPTLDEQRVEILKGLSSRLRTSSTHDVATRLAPRLGPSVVAALRARWRRVFRPLRVTVDRRWRWPSGEPALFVIVENRSDRELEVAGLDERGAFRLQAGEDHELDAPAPPLAGNSIAPEVKVGLRRSFRSARRPGVPLDSRLLGGEGD
jgi:hypothetical protein